MATDSDPRGAEGNRSSSGNMFTRKLGPLPVWAWLGIMTAGGLGIYLYEQHKQATAAASTGKGGQHPKFSAEAFVPGYGHGHGGGRGGGGQPPPSPKPRPKPQGGGQDVYRHVVSQEGLSLDQLASARHTTVQHIITTTEQGGQGGHLSADNLARFKAYVRGGTNRPMPIGLVYLTSSGPAEG
jgi:hypothetical protein